AAATRPLTLSIVVISALPRAETGSAHERSGLPLRNTVHAPHWAIPHPYFVPVRPSVSRNTHKSGVPPSTSTLCWVPLTLMVRAMAASRILDQVVNGVSPARYGVIARSSSKGPAPLSGSRIAAAA